MYIHVTSLIMCLSVILCNAESDQASASEEKALKLAKQAWKKIASAGGRPPSATAPQKEVDIYWGVGVLSETFDAFEEMLSDGEYETKLRYYIDQFGKHGPHADLKWLLARLQTTTNMHGAGGLAPVSDPRSRRRRHIQTTFAKLHVKWLLSHPKQLHRYYHAVLWLNVFFEHKHGYAISVADTVEGFRKYKRSQPEYWWYARNAILLLHATSRDDLLQYADPHNINDQYAKWLKWLKIEGNGAFLRPDTKTMTWRLDKKAKRNGDPYYPFIKQFRLKPFIRLPRAPFPDWNGAAPNPRVITD